MFLWFAALSVLIVWEVFQSPSIDYRMVALGSVLPLVELVVGGRAVLHTLLVPSVVLLGLVAVTGRHRLVRRRLIGIPIGWLLHLVLDATWADQDAFWWPAFGWELEHRALPVVERGAWGIPLEVIGAVVAVGLYRRFGLDDPGRRDRFLRTGQLERAHVAA